MNIINTESDGAYAYIAGYQGKQVGLYADSLWEAKQLAVGYFKPTKKHQGLLWVEKADREMH